MSWMISKALMDAYENSRSSQEQEEVSSAATCSDGAPSAPLSVMPTQHKFWRNDKTMEPSQLSRFGLTCAVLTEDLGRDLLTWFREDFLAKTYPSQEKAQASKEIDRDFGEKWHESLAKYDLASSTWKTHQCLWEEDLHWSSVTLPKWGMTLNGQLFQQKTAERPISETGSGLWPTPVRRDYRHPGRSRMERTGSKAGECLPQVVGGPLNPEWVEWLMGWPQNWTSLEPICIMDLLVWEILNESQIGTKEKDMPAMQWTDDPAEMGEWKIRLNIRQQKILLQRMQSFVSSSISFLGKGSGKEKGAETAQAGAMREMWCGEIPKASQGREHIEQLEDQYRVLVCKLPCCRAHIGRYLGKESNPEGKGLLHMWEVVQTEEGQRQALQREIMLRRIGEKICRVSLGKSQRAERIKSLGNGQVPKSAATAFHILSGGIHK